MDSIVFDNIIALLKLVPLAEQIEALRLDCDRQEVYYKTMISTHEVTIGQQTIRIKKLANNVQYLEQEIKKLKEENDKDMWDTTASGRGMVEYPFNPEGEKAPYPYTNPIRDIPEYSRIKVKK